jgi:hypothetical protein
MAGIPRWHARGQGFKSPQLHRKVPGETQRQGNPSRPPYPSKTPVRQASRQHRALPGNLNARPISSDLSVATPGPGGGLPSPTRSTTRGRSDRRYGPRADYPVAGAGAARACGIAVTRVGRPAPPWPGQLAPVSAAQPDGCRGAAALASQASVLSVACVSSWNFLCWFVSIGATSAAHVLHLFTWSLILRPFAGCPAASTGSRGAGVVAWCWRWR